MEYAFAAIVMICIALSPIVAYFGVKALLSLRHMARQSAAEHAQAMADAAKTHAEAEAIILQARQLPVNAGGAYGYLNEKTGAIVRPTINPNVSGHISITSSNTRREEAPVVGTQDEPYTPVLPVAPPFADLIAKGWKPSLDKMLLAYDANGPLWGDVTDLLSVGIAGRPKMGKSSLLRLIYAQMLLTGAQSIIFDLHGSIQESVVNLPAMAVANTVEELNIHAGNLNRFITKRLTAFRQGQRDFKPVLVLCDEFPAVSAASAATMDVINRVILEARKVGIFALVAGQGLPANLFGGSLGRDALSSRYVFKTTKRQASMAGLEDAMAAIPLTLERGYAVLDGPVMPTVVAIPYTTAADLQAAAYVSRPETSYAATEQRTEPPKQTIIINTATLPSAPDSKLDLAMRCYRPGMTVRDLAAKVTELTGETCSLETAAKAIKRITGRQ